MSTSAFEAKYRQLLDAGLTHEEAHGLAWNLTHGLIIDIDALDQHKHRMRLRRDAQADSDREAERNDGRIRS